MGAAGVAVVAAGVFAASPAQAAEVLLRVGDSAVPRGTIVQGDAIVLGGTLDVAGTVTGSAVAGGGSVHVSGHVGGDVRAMGGNVILDSTAVVDGTVQSVGGSVRIAPGAVIRRVPPPGASVPPVPFPLPVPPPRTPSSPPIPWPFPGPPAWVPPAFFGILAMWKLLAGVLILITLLTFIGMAWLTAAAFPGATAAVVEVLERNPGGAGIAGVVTWLLVGPIAVLLVLSVAGVVLVLLLIAALLIAVQVGISAVAVLVGRRVRPGRLTFEALVGSLLLTIAFAVPHLGWLAGFAAVTWGTGGVVVAVMERHRSQAPTPPAPPASPSSTARLPVP